MSDIKKFIPFGAAYKQYATVNGQPNPSATTQAQMQELLDNWSATLENLTSLLWKPATAYTAGQVVVSPNMLANTIAICVTAGTSGAKEPEWTTGGTNVTDNGVKWLITSRLGLTINVKNSVATIKGSAGEEITIDNLAVNNLTAKKSLTIAAGGVPAANANNNSVPTTNWVRTLVEASAASFAPKHCYNRRIEKSGNTAKLYWRDPDDTIADGNVIASWSKTVIVKKAGSYPTSPSDGTVVVTNTVKNKYASSPYTDNASGANYYYRAFPYNQEAYSRSELNKFDYFSYALYIDEDDPVEKTCVHAVAGYENYQLDNAFMDFTNDVFYWGGWENAQFLPRPCMLKSNGTVDYYLNPDDYTKKADGSASDVTNTSYDGNAMMEFPAIFTKVEHVGSKLYIYVASEKLDSGYECYSCLRSDGTYNKNFYLPIYEGYVLNNKMRSISSNTRPTGSTTAENEATYATANGAGWYTTTWADEQLMQILGVLVFGRLNMQVACGYNCGSSSSGLTHNCGSGNTKGMFYGKSSTGSTATKYFGMENWWGHRWRRCNGFMLIDYTVYVKMTRHSKDGSTTNEYNRTGSGYINTGLKVPSANESYIKLVHGSPLAAFTPKVVSGASSTTYYCDAAWSAGSTVQLLCGGGVASGAFAGLFAASLNNAPSNALWHYGASLSYHKP